MSGLLGTPRMRLATAVALLFLFPAVTLADDWPQFRGIHRDGISNEERLLKSWPAKGPELLWSVSGLGTGYSSVAVMGDRVYTAGGKDGKFVVFALTTAGKQLWETPIGGTGGGGYAGPRSTPTLNGDRLYVLGDEGDLACLKSADGAVVWSKNILRKYEAGNIKWKLSESVLVDGDRVICTPGGRAAMVAFDKKTGKEVWASEAVDAVTGYGSSMLVEYKGLRQIVGNSGAHVFGVRAEDGKLLWKQPQRNRYQVNATNVVFDGGVVFSTSGYGFGSQGLRLSVSGKTAKVKKIWDSRDLDDHFGGVVLHKGIVFGTGYRGALVALKLKSGAVAFRNKDIGKSSNIYADGRLYCQGHDGCVRLVSPSNGKVISSFVETPARRNQLWAHPAIANGVLYIRNMNVLKAFRIK